MVTIQPISLTKMISNIYVLTRLIRKSPWIERSDYSWTFAHEPDYAFYECPRLIR